MILPSSGEVRVDGKTTVEWDPVRLRRGNGYVIQEGGLFPHFTVERNIGLVPQLEGWPEAKVTARVSRTARARQPSRRFRAAISA